MFQLNINALSSSFTGHLSATDIRVHNNCSRLIVDLNIDIYIAILIFLYVLK